MTEPTHSSSKIAFPTKAYVFPGVCSCCLEPTSRLQSSKSTRTVGVPLVAAHKTTFTFEYPFCENCASRKARVTSETSNIGLVPFFAAIGAIVVRFVWDLTGVASVLDYVAIGVFVILWFVLSIRATDAARHKIRSDDQSTGHPPFCTLEGEPVDLCAWETFSGTVFEIKNPDFAKRIVESGRASYKG